MAEFEGAFSGYPDTLKIVLGFGSFHGFLAEKIQLASNLSMSEFFRREFQHGDNPQRLPY
ncbi:MAG: hypothetical protein WC986_01900 [Elusimicrobiota bacterium]